MLIKTSRNKDRPAKEFKDKIFSKNSSEKYRENWDKIFGKNGSKEDRYPDERGEKS